ncbi:MAG: hypothetical protein AAFX79_03535 [Planctomycetota bacterium]
MRRIVLGLGVLAAVLAAGVPVAGQDAPEQQTRSFDELRPPQRLGARVRALDRAVRVSPFVVVVRDERSFVEAVASWTAAARYPVLLDDGTWLAREGIARFVRAFEPEAVFGWSAEGGAEDWSADERREAIEGAVRRVWGVSGDASAGMAGAIEQWRSLGLTPAGAIVADPGDAAWPAALALAAGRAQPIVWMPVAGGANQAIEAADAELLCAAIEARLDGLGVAWRGLGDDVDAITLCANAPARIEGPPHGTIALTARLGRMGSASREAGRWAWTGQIFGSSARSAYAAMSSLFLTPRRAWLFDGYPQTPPWTNYDVQPAAGIYRQIGLGLAIDDAPRQGVADLLERAASPVDAQLIAFNTKGRVTEFHLEPGTASARDVPVLATPAAVYVVHSFSAQRPGIRTSVAGAWLDRGAFAYFGSVDEPGLQSFVPQVTLAARLGSLYPFAAAVREDGLLENRKLAFFGDPLWMLDAQPPQRIDAVPPLANLRTFPQAVGPGVADGIWGLRMSGDDARAAEVVLDALRVAPDSVDSGVAAAGLGALFAMGERTGFAAAFARLDPEAAEDPAVRDLAWHALRPLLLDDRAAATIARVLSGHVRPQRLATDALELAGALAASGEREEGIALLRRVLTRARTPKARRDLQLGIESFGG